MNLHHGPSLFLSLAHAHPRSQAAPLSSGSVCVSRSLQAVPRLCSPIHSSIHPPVRLSLDLQTPGRRREGNLQRVAGHRVHLYLQHAHIILEPPSIRNGRVGRNFIYLQVSRQIGDEQMTRTLPTYTSTCDAAPRRCMTPLTPTVFDTKMPFFYKHTLLLNIIITIQVGLQV